MDVPAEPGRAAQCYQVAGSDMYMNPPAYIHCDRKGLLCDCSISCSMLSEMLCMPQCCIPATCESVGVSRFESPQTVPVSFGTSIYQTTWALEAGYNVSARPLPQSNTNGVPNRSAWRAAVVGFAAVRLWLCSKLWET